MSAIEVLPAIKHPSSGLLAVYEATRVPAGQVWVPPGAAADAESDEVRALRLGVDFHRQMKAETEPLQRAAALAPPTEEERIAGIEALRLPGTDAAIDAAKANPSMTPSAAAPGILAAYRAHRGISPVPVASPSPADLKPATTGLEAYEREWRHSPKLQAEFETARSYAHYSQGIAAGRVRIYGHAANLERQQAVTTVNFALLPDQARDEFNASADLQREFGRVETYIAYRVGVAKGHIRPPIRKN